MISPKSRQALDQELISCGRTEAFVTGIEALTNQSGYEWDDE